MRNSEAPSCLAPDHRYWSHQRERREGASDVRLHFGVFRVQKTKVTHS
jgi:hypothetical protein